MPSNSSYTAVTERARRRVFTTSCLTQIRGRQLFLDVGRLAEAPDLPLRHHGGVVGDLQRGLRELLDEQDRDAPARDLRDQVVELRDDQRREAHRDLVQEQQRGI